MILLHANSADKAEKIKKLARKYRQQVREVDVRDLGYTVGHILDGKSRTNVEHLRLNLPVLYNMPELMVFSSVDRTELDAFLEDYKKLGLETISLKAIVTPTNINWPLYGLIEELKKEHGRLV